MVMLHGCHQDAKSFAASTRMNAVGARERFLVLYPEQDRLSNPQGCWNWFDTKSGRAYGEATLIMRAIDQVCILYSADRERFGIAGLSAGASMAALLVTRYPERFKAVTMHSGIPPGTAHSSLSAVGAMYGQRSTKPLPVALARKASRGPSLGDPWRFGRSRGVQQWTRCSAGLGERGGRRAGVRQGCSARSAAPNARDRLQTLRHHDGHAGRSRAPRARMERRCCQRAIQRPERS
jgi:poly(3-hydroxybutyrate) depolymerase